MTNISIIPEAVRWVSAKDGQSYQLFMVLPERGDEKKRSWDYIPLCEDCHTIGRHRRRFSLSFRV